MATPLSVKTFQISIHTALAGCDTPVTSKKSYVKIFQSTQPSQAVTQSDDTS